MRGVILDCDFLGPDDLEFSARFDLPVEWTVHASCSSSEIVERTLDAEIVMTNKTVINADTLSKVPNLKLISVLATGINVVDLEAAVNMGMTT
jgi:glycerate dehydrogenase